MSPKTHRQARRLSRVGGGLFLNAGSLPPNFLWQQIRMDQWIHLITSYTSDSISESLTQRKSTTETRLEQSINPKPLQTNCWQTTAQLGVTGGHNGNNGKAGKPSHPWEPRASDLSSKACWENWVGCFVLLALITAKCLSYSPPTTPTSLTSKNLGFFIAHPVWMLNTFRKCTFSPKQAFPWTS